MKDQRKFALIGGVLGHSFSKYIHSRLGDYRYDLCELKEDEIESFVRGGIAGFNVTVPYKREIIKYLDGVDEKAERIGAVNTVVKRDGKLFGYNTDYDGMKYMLARAGISLKDKKVVIFGSGGTSHTARAVAEDAGARGIAVVSRKGDLNYENYSERAVDAQIAINTTPVGMFPDNYSSPANVETLKSLEGVADVIYNPAMTRFLFQAKQRGVPYTDGLPMLIAQAKYASELFTGAKISDDATEEILSDMRRDKKNIVLIGMPGSGKSTVARRLSATLNRETVDTDEEIVKREKRSIPEIFSRFGEEYFRRVESEVIKDAGKRTGIIISTGGGAVTRSENLFPLSQNGTIFYLSRSLDKLPTAGRPLSEKKDAVEKLYSERKDAYRAFADVIVDNDGDIADTVKEIIEKL